MSIHAEASDQDAEADEDGDARSSRVNIKVRPFMETRFDSPFLAHVTHTERPTPLCPESISKVMWTDVDFHVRNGSANLASYITICTLCLLAHVRVMRRSRTFPT